MRKVFMKILCAVLISSILVLSGCDWSDMIEEGTYICETPYIKLTFDYSADHMLTQEIEVNRKVYKSIKDVGHGVCYFYEYQEEDIRPVDGLNLCDNEVYAIFDYKFDSKKKQLILTDQDTGNVYHLDKVD